MACSLGRYLFWVGETSGSHLFVFLETLDAHFSVKKRTSDTETSDGQKAVIPRGWGWGLDTPVRPDISIASKLIRSTTPPAKRMERPTMAT